MGGHSAHVAGQPSRRRLEGLHGLWRFVEEWSSRELREGTPRDWPSATLLLEARQYTSCKARGRARRQSPRGSLSSPNWSMSEK